MPATSGVDHEWEEMEDFLDNCNAHDMWIPEDTLRLIWREAHGDLSVALREAESWWMQELANRAELAGERERCRR